MTDVEHMEHTPPSPMSNLFRRMGAMGDTGVFHGYHLSLHNQQLVPAGGVML
jgi:hypothetical protein